MFRLVALAVALAAALSAQPTPRAGAAELQQALDRLDSLGSVLMFAAHPDDENTAVLSYFARGRKFRTAYLSATRGEGGQNLIGAEQGDLLGVIRTQELLAARRIDGAEQFFTRAIDFGYSKFPEEALDQWDRERLLADMVRTIRRFKPDVIVARFPPPPGDGGHGQHTAVGHLGPVAYEAAADPKRFRELGPPWRAKRYYWNVFQFGRPPDSTAPGAHPGRLTLEIGDYDPVLGKSYAEVAGESRSQHRSQAMGAAERRGSLPAQFDYVAGEKAATDLFDGIDTSWARVPKSARAAAAIARARAEYRPNEPEKIVPHLLEAWKELGKLKGHWPELKRAELLRAIELASGLWLDAAAPRWDYPPGARIPVELTVLNRSRTLTVNWRGGSYAAGTAAGAFGMNHGMTAEYNRPLTQSIEIVLSPETPYSQPPWLELEPDAASYNYADAQLIGAPEGPPFAVARFRVEIAGVPLEFEKPVLHRWVDEARGERTRPVLAVPPVAVAFTRSNQVFPSARPRAVRVTLTGNLDKADGLLSLDAPPGWRVEPASHPVRLKRPGEQTTATFQVSPGPGSGSLRAALTLSDGAKVSRGQIAIDYEHIPVQVVFPEARMRVAAVDVTLLSRKIGYVMGAGDLVPEALRELGAEVTLLSPNDLTSGNLGGYDAIVAGVRALNTRPDLHAARERIFEYVERGGTFVLQYNTFERRGPSVAFGPYPLKEQTMTRDRIDRIVDEAAPVKLLDPDHPLLAAPNRITEADFEGWVQERGLYFMGEWDERYSAPTESADAGQPPQRGGLLYARYGKGAYVFTGYSFFRQLPAGVPGAYRLFANLVSAGKSAAQ